MIEAETGGQALLTVVLKDGAAGEAVSAAVIDAAGAAIAGSPFALVDRGGGLYSATIASPAEGDYSIRFSTTDPQREVVSEQLRVRPPVAEAILTETLASFIAPGTVGEALIIAGAQGGLAVRIDALSYDANDRPLTFRVRIFPDTATANASTPGGTGEGEILTLFETATHIDANRWQSLVRGRV